MTPIITCRHPVSLEAYVNRGIVSHGNDRRASGRDRGTSRTDEQVAHWKQ